MAKTLITTPFPEPADVARMMGVSPARFRELVALVDRIESGSRKRKAGRVGGALKHKAKSVSKKRS